MDVEVENLVSVCVSLDPTQKKKYGNQGVSKKKCEMLVLLSGIQYWLVVSTHLNNISQNGNLPQVGMKKKNI